MILLVILLLVYVIPSISAAATVLVECPVPAGTSSCITVGLTTSQTGAQSVEGQLHRNGTIMWANKVNGKGGLQTRVNPGQASYIRVVAYDDASNPTLCAQQYSKLINEDRVDHLLGPYGTSLTQAASIVANNSQRIMIAGAAAADNTYSTSLPNLFGVDTTGSQYMTPLLNTLYQRGARNLVILTSDAAFAQSVSDGATMARSLGYDIPAVRKFARANASATVLLPIMNELAAYNADVFIASILLENGENVLNGLIASRYRPRAFILQSAGGSPAFVAAQGIKANHILAPSQWEPTTSFTGTLYNDTAEYLSDYQSLYGTLSSSTLPSYISAEATAAGVVLGVALSNATSHNITDLSSFLHSLPQPINTFFGPIQFDNTGRNIAKQMVGTQVINGKIELVVARAGIMTTNLIYPMQWLVPPPNSASSIMSISHIIMTSLLLLSCLCIN